MLRVYVESNARGAKFRTAAALAGVPLAVEVVPPSHPVVSGSPLAQLPVLSTPHGPLNRTFAILRYIAQLREDSGLTGGGGGDSLFSESAAEGFVEWAAVDLEPAVVLLSSPSDAAAFLGGSGKELAEASAAAASRLAPLGSFLNAHLSSRTYLAGERLSVADVVVGTAVAALWDLPGAPLGAAESLPHLARWHFTLKHAFAAAAAPTTGASAPPPQRTALDAVLSAGSSAHVPTPVETRIPSEKFFRARARICDLLGAGEAAAGRDVVVCGWLKTQREGAAGALQFMELNDGSGFATLQVVAEKGKTAGFEEVGRCGGTGASLRVEGAVVKSPAKGQVIELLAAKVVVLGAVDDAKSYPLAKKKHSVEHLREILHLRPRTNTMGAVTRVRNACAFATHKFFQDRGFLYIHTPIITAADCEGAGEMFAVSTIMPPAGLHGAPPLTASAAGGGGGGGGPPAPLPRPDLPRNADGSVDFSKDFFGRPAMLTVSGQLQVEAFACSLSDVYTFGPTFRAENSHTSRHLAEFWMIEPEIAFATLEEDMALAEDFLKFCTQWVLDHCAEDLAFFEAQVEKGLRERLRNVVAEPFQRLTYTEAIALLLEPKHQAAGKFKEKVSWGIDLASEHERYITEQVFKKPVILINYPKDIKAFYMKLNDDGKTVRAMDVLVPKIGEIIGGSQREDNEERLRRRMAEMNVPTTSLEWYLQLRKFGTCPHAGFGLGFERLVMYVTGMENIRDVIPYPRWPGNAEY